MIFGKKRFHIVIRQRRYDLALDWMNYKFMKLVYCQKQYIKYACMHTLAITLVTYALPAPFYRKENISIEK